MNAVSANDLTFILFRILNRCGIRKNLIFWSKLVRKLWYIPVLVRVGSRFHIYSGPGPSWSEIFWNIWSWSELVRDFPKIFGPGPTWSEIFGKYLVLVRPGPGFLNFFRSWSGPVLGPNRTARFGTDRFRSLDPCCSRSVETKVQYQKVHAQCWIR